jgi:hypothetical protein
MPMSRIERGYLRQRPACSAVSPPLGSVSGARSGEWNVSLGRLHPVDPAADGIIVVNASNFALDLRRDGFVRTSRPICPGPCTHQCKRHALIRTPAGQAGICKH